MRKVMLIAYDQMNLGDDLFVHTIVNRYPNVKFYMWTSLDNKKVFGSLANMHVLDRDSKVYKFLSYIRPSFGARYKEWREKNCNALVYIGGSLFIEYENWKTILTWWEYEAEHRNFYVLGANFGPYQTEEYRIEMASIFEKMKDVCFRDRISKEMFTGVSTVRYAPDILFGVRMPTRKDFEKKVFISVIDCARKNEGLNKLASFDDVYIRSLLKLVQAVHNEGYKVVLASFCKVEGDEEGINKILDRISDKSVKDDVNILCYSGLNKDEMLQGLADSDIVVGTRFHAVILGLVANKTVIPVIYSDKTVNVLQDAEFNGVTVDVRKMQENDLANAFIACKNQLPYNVSEMKKMSEEQFAQLDILLKYR